MQFWKTVRPINVFIITLSRVRVKANIGILICTPAGSLESSSSQPKHWYHRPEELTTIARERRMPISMVPFRVCRDQKSSTMSVGTAQMSRFYNSR